MINWKFKPQTYDFDKNNQKMASQLDYNFFVHETQLLHFSWFTQPNSLVMKPTQIQFDLNFLCTYIWFQIDVFFKMMFDEILLWLYGFDLTTYTKFMIIYLDFFGFIIMKQLWDLL
jgi:hypothetical protein